jgi:hypothetical protein
MIVLSTLNGRRASSSYCHIDFTRIQEHYPTVSAVKISLLLPEKLPEDSRKAIARGTGH